MRFFRSQIDKNSPQFQSNCVGMQTQLTRLNNLLRQSLAGGGEKNFERHRNSGKILPRDRIELLLDAGSHFLELMPLAGYEIDDHVPGAGLIGGIGVISGVECMIVANESTVKGGALSGIGVQKGLRLSEIATQNHLPLIHMTESAGGDLPNQSQVFVPGGQTFADISRRSKMGFPTICVVFGNSTAGGAYIPGMSDYVVMVKERAKVFLAGPPLVKMATGEESDDETLGGAWMHAHTSGVSDYLAIDEHDGIRMVREIVTHLRCSKKHFPERVAKAPYYDSEELLGLTSGDLRIPFDQREVIARIVDESKWEEFKAYYGETLVCGWAFIHGYLVGILANNGVLFSESANKAAQFVQLCNSQGTPLIFLQNTTGFMVGKKYEQEGIIKNGAKLINAVANSEVPLLTVMTGASYGAGNYGMAGRSLGPRFLFTWPNHKIAIMGPEQLAGVVDIIKRESAQKRGISVDEEQLQSIKEMIKLQIEKESDAFFATARIWDDGVIDPRQTRDVLGISLSALSHAPVVKSNSFGVFRH